jgi:DNA-binding NarL/FixJ family response regulator
MIQNPFLSQREKEITALVATGVSNKEIARQLAISEKTVKNILTKVFAKTCTQSRTELAVQWGAFGKPYRYAVGGEIELVQSQQL